MSDDSKNKQAGKTEDKIGFLDRLIYGKGTVAEPWPSVQEVLADEEVQKDIKKVREAFKVLDKKS